MFPVPASRFPLPASRFRKLLLGAHTSIAGGTHEAPPRAKAIGATAMQIFTKMANRWAERECEPPELESFRAAVAATDLQALNAHDSYLIDLASPDPALRARSIRVLRLRAPTVRSARTRRARVTPWQLHG